MIWKKIKNFNPSVLVYRKAVVGMFKNSTKHRQELATQVTGKIFDYNFFWIESIIFFFNLILVSEYIKSSASNASRRRITRNSSWTDSHELQLLRTVK